MQSLNDMSTMLAMPGLVCCDPVTPRHARALLDWAVSPANYSSVYFRLRRTACPQVAVVDAAARKQGGYRVNAPLLVRDSNPDVRSFLVSMGTVPTHLALRALQEPPFRGWGLIVVSALGLQPDLRCWWDILRGCRTLFTIEDDLDPGSLRPFVHRVSSFVQSCHSPPLAYSSAAATQRWKDGTLPAGKGGVALLSHTIGSMWPAPSFRTQRDCLAHFRFTPQELCRKLASLRKVRSAL